MLGIDLDGGHADDCDLRVIDDDIHNDDVVVSSYSGDEQLTLLGVLFGLPATSKEMKTARYDYNKCEYVWIYACMVVCMYVCLNVFMYVCMNVCYMYVYIMNVCMY